MKKSRVERFKDLHRAIAADAESSVENSNLSDFAKRLNEIDSQFEQIKTSQIQETTPERARSHEEQDSAYLQNFLDEVKAYNVKKGYRHHEDTEAHLLEEIRQELEGGEIDYFDEIPKENTVPSDIESFNLVEEETEDLPTETKLFGEGILEDDEEQDDISSAVQELVDEIDEGVEDNFEDDDFDEDLDEVSTQFTFDTEHLDTKSLREELLSQTQTLQHRIVDQEKNIDEMNEKMSRTNRLLNVILSFLIFAIIVIILIIVKQFLQF